MNYGPLEFAEYLARMARRRDAAKDQAGRVRPAIAEAVEPPRERKHPADPSPRRVPAKRWRLSD